MVRLCQQCFPLMLCPYEAVLSAYEGCQCDCSAAVSRCTHNDMVVCTAGQASSRSTRRKGKTLSWARP